MKTMLGSDQTTFILAKGTAAATDPADLPRRIPVGGILEVRQNYLTDNTLAFADQSPVIPSRILFHRHFDQLIISHILFIEDV